MKQIRKADRPELFFLFIDIFEDFLDEKGVVIKHPVDADDDESVGTNIYGEDYDRLCGEVENLLIAWGLLGEESEDVRFHDDPDKETNIYTVEYTLTLEVEASDSVEAIEKADRIANLSDAYVYVDGNWW